MRKWKLHHATRALPRQGHPSKLRVRARRGQVREATVRTTITLKELQSSGAEGEGAPANDIKGSDTTD